jgi:Protein of unknown function (DUF3105)
LARKSRTPPPPRRAVQAPKVRTTPKTSTPEEDRRRLLILVAIAASGLLALGVVVALFAFGSGSSSGAGGANPTAIAQTMRDAGCTFNRYVALKNNSSHADVPSIGKKVNWNSNPPTSGPHYGQWAVWGAYDRPVPLTMSTHNLEHGGIVMHYGPKVPRDEVAKLRDFYRSDPNAMILAPLPTMGDKIVLSAWYFDESKAKERNYYGQGEQAKCTTTDADAFAAFRDTFRYKGRERIPAENLQPGM